MKGISLNKPVLSCHRDRGEGQVWLKSVIWSGQFGCNDFLLLELRNPSGSSHRWDVLQRRCTQNSSDSRTNTRNAKEWPPRFGWAAPEWQQRKGTIGFGGEEGWTHFLFLFLARLNASSPSVSVFSFSGSTWGRDGHQTSLPRAANPTFPALPARGSRWHCLPSRAGITPGSPHTSHVHPRAGIPHRQHQKRKSGTLEATKLRKRIFSGPFLTLCL